MQKVGLSIRDMCFIGIFTAVTAICAQIAIPLPFTPIHISFGMVGVYAAGILLPPRCAVLSQVCYLLLGAVGVPVFGGFRGGPSALVGPTGGYLLVYPFMVAIVAVALNGKKALEREKNSNRKGIYVKTKGVLALCAAHLLLYLGGTIWLCLSTQISFKIGLAEAVYPFIPMDIVKLVFCTFAIIPMRSRFMNAGLLNFSLYDGERRGIANNE